jgi:para-aminobenzoate synthetase component 1
VITVAAPALPSAEVARRLGRGRAPCWLCSPGAADLGLARELLAVEPVRVVAGGSMAELLAAWAEARAAWSAGPEVPVGVGYLSYDLGRGWGRVRGTPPPASGWPALEFRFYDAFWVRDAASGTAHIQATSAAAAAALAARLAVDAGPPAPVLELGALGPVEPPARHLAAVERALAYIRAGDIYQVNLARRLRAAYRSAGPPGLDLFTRLAAEAPAPHALWLGDAAGDPAAGTAIVGNSPERFLRVEVDGTIETCPIKGTRARGADPAADAAALAALLADAKDRAEHVMIVDLERNDLGRICATGSVEVVGLMRPLSLPSVHHLVSTVRGRLLPGLGLEEILAATFPGGSIVGAPKLRAMEIIDELEPGQRGPYTGATGWLGAAGDLDLAVAIRTGLVRDGELTLWVGGGIVADSDPRAELAETTAKAGAFARLAAPDEHREGSEER